MPFETDHSDHTELAGSHADGECKCDWHDSACASDSNELMGYRDGADDHGTAQGAMEE